MKPVDAEVTTRYGKPGNWAAGYHTGLDYAVPEGTIVRATRRGFVVRQGWDKDYGNYVVVSSWHKTRRIHHWYCHLSKAVVFPGERVRGGNPIGLSGNTGNSTGPHLHYEERVKPYGYWNHILPVLPNWRPRRKK